MRKSRLKILPARCLAQLGFLLLYLACPILGEMSRAQPDHGLASSLTLHVLEHCASPPKDPGDGSCFSVPEDVKVMTRNENGHATCSVATHLLNLATKCAPEEQPLSKQSSKATTVTLVPRRLLAARSKLPASTQEPIKSLPKRQFRHRSLKRDSDISLRDSSILAEQNLIHSERDALRRSTNAVRRSAEERRNMRTEVTRTTSRIGSDNFRDTTSERLNSRNLNRNAFRSAYTRDTNRAVQGESRGLRHTSYSRVTPSDIRNKLEPSERIADKGRQSSSSAERRVQESRVADHRSRHMDVRRISLAVSPERRMESRTATHEPRRLSVERTLVQTELNGRRGSLSRTSILNSSRDRSYRRIFAERRLSDSRTTETERRKSPRRLASQGSRTAVREQLSQERLTEIRLQNDEPRRSLTERKLHERSSEARTRESQAISLAARQTIDARLRTSPDRLSFRSLVSDRAYRRNSGERLSLQRSSKDRRLTDSEGRVSAEQRTNLLGSTFEGRISASRTPREDTRRRLSETRRSSSPLRERYDSARTLLGITRERQALGMSRQTLSRRVSDERATSRSRDGEVTSRLIRENNILSGTRRTRRSISLDRSDSNRAYFSRARRSLSMTNDRRDFYTTAAHSVSGVNRVRNIASRNLNAEIRMSDTSRQQRLSARRDMEGRSRAVLRELSLSEVRERVRTSRERRTESPASFTRRARSLEERSASRRTFTMERRELPLSEVRERQRTSRERRTESPASFTRRARSLEERSASRRTFTMERRELPLSEVRERQRTSRERRTESPASFTRRARSLEERSASRRTFTMERRELPLSEVRERQRTSRERRTESPASFTRRARSLEERSASRRTFAMERRELSLSEIRERVRTSRERRTESPESFTRRARSLEERSASRRTFTMERREVRGTRNQDRAVERLSKDVTLMERRDIRRAVSERSFSDRRFTFRAASRSSDPLLASRREEERHRVMPGRSALESFNVRSRSAERENRRAISYGSTRRGTLESHNLGRIWREDSLSLLRNRRADSSRNAGRRTSTKRTADVRDSTRSLNERDISRLSRRASIETRISADRRNMHRISTFRSAKVQDIRVTMADSTRLQDTLRRLEQTHHSARTVRVRSMERENNYRIGSVSVERAERQNVWVIGRGSQRDDRFNRQLKATSAGHFLRRNVRAVSLDAIRRQSTNRQNALILSELRTTQDGTYQTRRYSRSSELREDRRYVLSVDRKNTLRDARQSNDRLMSTMQYGRRATDSMRITRSSKSRNFALNRERREYSNYARFNRKAVSSQELSRKSQRYEFSAFRKQAVHDNRLITSKTDNYRVPEITAKNETAKTDMVREAKVEAFKKYTSSWLKDLTTTCSMKWNTGALWQQIFLILATLSWTKTGCIDTITDKVSSYLFTSENMDIIGATKIATSNDRDNLLGTVIGGGAAAAALLLFSTRTK